MNFQIAVQQAATQEAQKLAKVLAKPLAENLAKKKAIVLAKQKVEKEAPKFIQIGVAQGKKEGKRVIIEQFISSGLKKSEGARMLQMSLQELEALLA